MHNDSEELFLGNLLNLMTAADYNFKVKNYSEAIKSYEKCVKVFNQN